MPYDYRVARRVTQTQGGQSSGGWGRRRARRSAPKDPKLRPPSRSPPPQGGQSFGGTIRRRARRSASKDPKLRPPSRPPPPQGGQSSGGLGRRRARRSAPKDPKPRPPSRTERSRSRLGPSSLPSRQSEPAASCTARAPTFRPPVAVDGTVRAVSISVSAATAGDCGLDASDWAPSVDVSANQQEVELVDAIRRRIASTSSTSGGRGREEVVPDQRRRSLARVRRPPGARARAGRPGPTTQEPSAGSATRPAE